VDYDVCEEDAFNICREADLLSPAYNGGRTRLGCWFCHNQRIAELKRLCYEHPELWEKLMRLDRDSPVTFKPDKTLGELDKRFRYEGMQLTLFDL